MTQVVHKELAERVCVDLIPRLLHLDRNWPKVYKLVEALKGFHPM